MNNGQGQTGAELPGDLGPYRFDRRLGVGGMGEVFLAFDRRLGRNVAIKRLRLDHDAGTARERFRREARAAARLGHAAIVQVFDLIETDAGDWIVMEYVEGPRLTDLVAQGPLPLRSVLLYGRQIAEGLSAAHALGFVHRDLKTENVLIARSDPPAAKILDFGLVRELPAEGDPGTDPLTRAGVLVGTLRSVAPEQVLGLAVGPRTDLFSLGILLYEIVAARSPFQGATAAETLHRIVAEPYAPLPPDLPAGVAALIGQLLQKAPELRPASAAEVARKLARLSTELGATVEEHSLADSETAATESLLVPLVAARDSRSLSGLRRFPTRHVIAAAVIGVLLVGAVYFGLFPKFSAQRPSAERSDAAQPFPASARPLSVAERKAFERQAWTALDRYDLPGNLDRAVALFQRLIEDDLDSAPAHAGLARAYWQKLGEEGGDTMWREQALAVARRAVELDGNLASARVSLGFILLKAGERDEAKVELERARTLDPKNADAHRGLGELHLAAEQTAQAEASYKRAIALQPTNRTFHNLLGTLYFRMGRMQEAEVEFRRSVALAPDGIYGLRNLAGALIATNRLPEATEILKRALTVHPDATLFGNLGTVYFYQGLYPAAADAYQKALGFPDAANRHDMWGNLGDAWRQIPHRRNEAQEAFRNASRLIEPDVARDPKNAKLRSQWALYLAKAGQRTEALREVAQVDTTEGRTLFRLAIASELTGDRERALDLLEHALQRSFSIEEVSREPDLLDLRSDTRFQRFLTRPYP